MSGGGMPDMPGMDGGGGSNGTATGGMKKVMMHMTFFWGKDVDVLFSGFPGARKGVGLYLLCLFFILFMAFLVEALSMASHRLGRSRPGVASGLGQTTVHACRVGLAYLVMLATMSFNGGVLIAAVLGHALGFFVFGSSAFRWGRAEYDQIARAGAGHPRDADKS